MTLIITLPTIPVSLVSQLRNHAPPITIRRIIEHYDNFDEETDDDLDKVTSNKASNNLLEEQSVAVLSACFDQEVQDQFQKLEASDYPQFPQAAVTSTTSAGIY